jgi:hypothetical protein
VFKRIDQPGVTSKPIGLHAAGDRYEVIVPKSTPYPAPERIVRRFVTADDTEKGVRVGIYQAEQTEFEPGDMNQWVGAADIALEGQLLPAGTPLDVGIAIDRDGCLDVEVAVQDGSAIRRRVFLDPRIGSPPPGQHKICPQCGYSNDPDAERCANPAGCPHVFNGPEPPLVLELRIKCEIKIITKSRFAIIVILHIRW